MRRCCRASYHATSVSPLRTPPPKQHSAVSNVLVIWTVTNAGSPDRQLWWRRLLPGPAHGNRQIIKHNTMCGSLPLLCPSSHTSVPTSQQCGMWWREVYRRFGGTYCLRLHRWRISETSGRANHKSLKATSDFPAAVFPFHFTYLHFFEL
jgi:hypothetical protein